MSALSKAFDLSLCLVVAGPQTFLGEALEMVGAESALKSGSVPWPTLSLEALASLLVDYIVMIEGVKSKKFLETEIRPLRSQQSLKRLRVVAADKPILQRPGFELPNEIRILRSVLQ